MGEIIITTRFLSEDNHKSVKSSRCGVSWMQDGELKSVVFNPQADAYSVPVMDVRVDQFMTIVAHIFVERWVKKQGITVPYEIWRSHVELWPAREEPPFAYVPPVREEVVGKDTHRYAIEHIAGPHYVTPEFLYMELSAGSIPEATIDQDLVPERQRYTQDFEFLYHPGLYPGEMGILGQYEDVLIRTREPKPTFVM